MKTTIAAITKALASTDLALHSFAKYRNSLPPTSPVCHDITTGISILRDAQEQLTAARHIAEENRNLADIIEEDEPAMTLPDMLDLSIKNTTGFLKYREQVDTLDKMLDKMLGAHTRLSFAAHVSEAARKTATEICAQLEPTDLLELALNTPSLATSEPPAPADNPADGILANVERLLWQETANQIINDTRVTNLADYIDE